MKLILLIAQMTCVGRACELYQPQVVQCSNMGDDGLGNVQWKVGLRETSIIVGPQERGLETLC